MRPNRAHIHKPAAAALATLLVGAVACQEESPTALGGAQLPEEPLTVQVELTWDQFGSGLQVFGGYATPASVPRPVVAHTYQGALESRPLLRFAGFPATGTVVDSTGTTVNETDFTYVHAFLTLGFDTLTSVSSGPVSVEIRAIQEEWDAGSASWAFAVDSIGDQRAWTEPGAGPAPLLATGVWDPSASDSVDFVFDSASIAGWVDGADQSRGARVEVTTDSVLLELSRVRFRVNMRPSSNPDTLVEDTVSLANGTFVYDPPPAEPTAIRVGGVPAWRSALSVAPPVLTGPPSLCEAVGCPFTPQPGQVLYAGLQLTPRASEAAFQPTDTVRLDVRPVLSPTRVRKSPLGASETSSFGTAIPPDVFGSSTPSPVEIPISNFMRTLLGGPDATGRPPPGMLALLAAPEPASLSFASFDGPGDPGEPLLRLILTVGDPQGLP